MTPPDIVDRLRALIFDSQLAAGSDHLEQELAQRLDVSRTPVREAARTLAAQGLVELRPRKGLRVLPISAQDMAEVYDVLTALEGMAAGDAARAGHGPRDLAGLTTAITNMETALARKDRDGWASADDVFHNELVRLGGNSRTIGIVAMMADQVRRARTVTLYLRPLPVKSNAAHRGVLTAISQGDAATAQRLHTAHRVEAKALLLGLLDRHHLRQL